MIELTVYDLLNCTHARIVLHDKWLVLNKPIFTVYQRKPYQRNTKTIYEGIDEDKAVRELMS